MSMFPGITAVALSAVLGGQTQTAAPQQQRPEMLERLMACRSVTGDAARLACYDTAAGAFDSAERDGELVVIDRAQAEETRRQLFGFELPTLPRLFEQDEATAIQSIETTLQSASQLAENRWVFRLADGGVWRQVDSDPVRFQNRAGQPVRVRRAALGSYMLTVGNSRAVRVRRQ